MSFITHDGSVHTLRQDERYKSVQVYGKIEIGDNSFIGANVTIMPNVYIGKNCIVGACSLVTKSIPDNSVAVGIPARVVGNTWEFAEKKLKNMPSNWDDDEYKKNMEEYLKRVIPSPNNADN